MTNQSKAPQKSVAPALFCAPDKRRGVLVAAILASSLGFIDSTVVTIALPAMRSSLDATLPQAQWFQNAYMLLLAALILTGGAFGDRFGLARTFSCGILAFVVASLACAVAPTPEFMIAARAAKGIGAALMVPGSLALISRAYPREERGRAIGLWAAASALTTAAGPIIGGLVLTFGGPEFWRWIFAINLPLGAMALVILWRSVQQDITQGEDAVDWIGAILATASLGSVAYGLTLLQTDGPAFFFLALGATLSAAFLWHEARAPAPMMPLSLFKDARFAAANLATFMIYAGLGAMLFFLPMTVITAWGVTPIEASAAFAPLSVFISTLSAPVGRAVDRFGPEPIIAIGAALVALAYVSVGISAPLQNYWGATFPGMVLSGAGMALVVAPLSAAVMASVKDSQTGTASGVNNAISRMASLITIAAFGTLAALTYAGANGDQSFGEIGTSDAHVAASTAAFAAIAFGAAAVSAFACASILLSWRRRAA